GREGAEAVGELVVEEFVAVQPPTANAQRTTTTSILGIDAPARLPIACTVATRYDASGRFRSAGIR
ncbi:MAG TPA: hypothetical protein VNY84_11990, partial [Acidimicrobiales bacterium]|nr:hypothetical protein [Acidimicrobiales bacterium]